MLQVIIRFTAVFDLFTVSLRVTAFTGKLRIEVKNLFVAYIQIVLIRTNILVLSK